MLEYTISTVTG